jgi:hypothetical protein
LLWPGYDVFVGSFKPTQGHDMSGAIVSAALSLAIVGVLGGCAWRIARHAVLIASVRRQLLFAAMPLLGLLGILTLWYSANYFDGERHCYIVDSATRTTTTTSTTPGAHGASPSPVVCNASRLSAFYFSVANLSTFGTSDVRAVGTPGRTLLVGQMISDSLALVGVAAILFQVVDFRRDPRDDREPRPEDFAMVYAEFPPAGGDQKDVRRESGDIRACSRC